MFLTILLILFLLLILYLLFIPIVFFIDTTTNEYYIKLKGLATAFEKVPDLIEKIAKNRKEDAAV